MRQTRVPSSAAHALPGHGFHKPAGRSISGGLPTLLLLLTLLAPSGFALWAAVASYQAGAAARLAATVPDLLSTARVALVEEELLSRQYRLRPNAATSAQHDEAASKLSDALAQAKALSPVGLAVGIDGLFADLERYAAAAQAIFTAASTGDPATAVVDARVGEDEFAALTQGLLATLARSLRHEAVFDDRLMRLQFGVLVGTPVVFVLNLALAVALLLIRRAHRQRDHAVAAREAESLRLSERRLQVLVQHASDVVVIASSDGTITYGSPAAATLWGYTDDMLLGRSVQTFVHPEDQPALQDLWQQLQDAPGATRNTELRVQRSDGTWRQVELVLANLLHEPAIGGFVVTARDVEERKAFEQQLTQRAFFDSLTALPNRLLFQDRIEQALIRARRHRCLVGLLFIDLDNFKLINDSLGHTVGDQLLVHTAARLLACVRGEDTVARLGGDEFVVLLDCLNDGADTQTVANAIVSQFKCPFMLDGRDVIVSVSIGMTFGDAAQEDGENLLRHADVAMYRAKSRGKGQCVLFDASMHQDALARLELENDLRHALDNDEFRVHYQPIVQLHTGRLLEVEALVRWQHPTRGLILPGHFIGVAEETGLIIPLGRWVLEQACRQAVAWQALSSAEPLLTLSVNLSPRQFQQPDLDREVAAILQRTGLNPCCLKLEITEGVIMEDTDRTIAILGKLKSLGLKLAIDDFGTGYSSLAYLKRLPLDVLKIDRSFVKGIGQNHEDTAIVRTIMSLAQSLNLSVTGEGIETADQAALLDTMGCNRGQGYFFARPLDADGLAALLQSGYQQERGVLPVPAAADVGMAATEQAA